MTANDVDLIDAIHLYVVCSLHGFFAYSLQVFDASANLGALLKVSITS